MLKEELPPTVSGDTSASQEDDGSAAAGNGKMGSGRDETRVRAAVTKLLADVRAFSDEVAGRSNQGEAHAPIAELERLTTLGAFTAPLPVRYGGLGLGSERGGHQSLLRLLAAVGSADLVLGRLYEGHVNALLLVVSFGSAEQIARASEEAHAGLLFGVWNTGAPELLKLEQVDGDRFRFVGVKTFATGAAFVRRPVVTADLRGGWQMAVPVMEAPEVRKAIQLDRSFWHPLGMEASESYRIDFTDAVTGSAELIGEPGDFYRDPLFRGGAVRFAAVQAGAILRLYRLFTQWLERNGRGDDPYQVARLGEIAIHAQEAVLWIERAGAVAEDGLHTGAEKLATERMVECAGMTRLAIERLGTAVMQRVVAGVGAHGLLRPHPFEQIIRNLTMYLRQPAPDQTLAEVGRASLRKARLQAGGAEGDLWQQASGAGSMPASYFDRIYEQARDPWNFEESPYEAEKYQTTLSCLPRQRYRRALEVGCSIGVLTKQLAARCDALLSIDVSERALGEARERCRDLEQVTFARMQVPQEIPDGDFDLILFSEVGYYLERDDLERTAAGLAQRQPPGADLILVHFTPPVKDYPMTGDQVHEVWLARPEWTLLQQERREGYRLDVLRRNGPES